MSPVGGADGQDGAALRPGHLLCLGGRPGSGKTTVGQLVAAARHAALVDLDSVTTPLLEAVGQLFDVPVTLDRPPLASLRAARYACMGEVIHDTAGTGVDVVAVAPFTLEARDTDAWRAWGLSLGAATTTVCLLDIGPSRARERLIARGLPRDSAAQTAPSASARGVPVDLAGVDAVLDATSSPESLAASLLSFWNP